MRKVFKLLEATINNGDINEINEAFKNLCEPIVLAGVKNFV